MTDKNEPTDNNDDFIEQLDEQDGIVIEKHELPYNISIKSENMGFYYFANEERVLVPMNGYFEVMIRPYGTQINEQRIERVDDLFKNISGSVFLSSNADMTPLFNNGTLNNLTFELPVNPINAAVICTFMYYKAEALLGNYGSIMMFKFVPSDSCCSIYIDIHKHHKANPYIDEDEWISIRKNLIQSLIDEGEYDGEDEGEYVSTPWWHRDDNSTRDYIYGLIEGEEADIVPETIVMGLAEPSETEITDYPLYTEKSILNILEGFKIHKIETLPIEVYHDHDVVLQHKHRITIGEFLSAVREMRDILDQENDDDDDDDGIDDLIITGKGRE